MAETELLWRLADTALQAGDFERARDIWERGAGLGDPECWVGLGVMFDVGQGVEVDKHRAMRCYKTAWRSRNLSAANNIAVLYREWGNKRAMFQWFERAARHGDDEAYLELAKCYRDGLGVRKSLPNAVRCLAKVTAGSDVSEAGRDEAAEMLASFQPRAI